MRCPSIHVMVHSYRARTIAYYDALHVCASAARFSMHLYAYIEAAITTHTAMLLILASICITTRIDVCEGQRCTFVTCMDMRLLRMHLHYIDRCAWFCLQPHIFSKLATCIFKYMCIEVLCKSILFLYNHRCGFATCVFF